MYGGAFIYPFLFLWSVIGFIAGFFFSTGLFRRPIFNLATGRGTFVGALPLLTSIFAVSLVLSDDLPAPWTVILLVGCSYALLGLIRDIFRIGFEKVFPWLLLLAIAGQLWGVSLSTESQALSSAISVIWPVVIISSLKLSSLIFEMPFILCMISGFTFMTFLAGSQLSAVASTGYAISLAVSSGIFLLFRINGRRLVQGDSGLFLTGWLLSSISLVHGSTGIFVFGLLIPSMVIVYPALLISIVFSVSFIGNRLYRRNSEAATRLYDWTLRRESLVILTGTVFLCLNSAFMIYSFSIPWIGAMILVVLLTTSVASFGATFARRAKAGRPTTSRRVSVLGVKIDPTTPGLVVRTVDEWLGQTGTAFHHIVTADSLAVVRAASDRTFRRVLRRANLVVPDGAGIIWAADFLGTPLPCRVPGVALSIDLCRMAAERGTPVYFLGAAPDTADRAVENLKRLIPKLEVAGIHHGFFQHDSELETNVMKKICDSNAGLVLVAMGVPRQEHFITVLRQFFDAEVRLNPAVSRPIVTVGIGGSFDVISETLPRAPAWMQRFALEWLFRLWLQPGRYKRMLGIPSFVLQVLRYKWNHPDRRKGV